MVTSIMRFLITLVSMLLVVESAKAQTTTNVNVGGQNYTVTYDTSTTYTANSGTISGQDWFGGFGTDAQTWANATSVANVRYAYAVSGSNVGYLLADGSGGSSIGSAAQSASASYAISAVAVPAPLPILGILPVVGFLKRMRKRQRA